jgi:hypothetical protein
MFGANVALEWETNVYIANRYLGTMLIFFYRLIGGFIIVSLFVTVIDEAYEAAQSEVEQTHANDVFLSNIKIQINKLQKKLYFGTAWGKRFIPKPSKFALQMENLLKAADLKVSKRYHRRSTEERLINLEKILKKIYSVQKRQYFESVSAGRKNSFPSTTARKLETRVSSLNFLDYQRTENIDKQNNRGSQLKMETLKEELKLSEVALKESANSPRQKKESTNTEKY